MKIYTEEQVRQAYNLGFVDGYDVEEKCENSAISLLTPIELPSDEEIDEKSHYKISNNTKTPNWYFIAGAKWMKEQILGKEDKTFKQKSKWTEVDNMTRRLK